MTVDTAPRRVENATASGAVEIGDRLILAAIDVFAEFGYDGATVAEIARRAGVTTGAIYRRYSGKAELMADAIGTHLAERFERILPEAPSGGTDLLSSLGTHLLDPPDASRWLAVEAIVAMRRHPEVADTIRRSFEGEASRINSAVQQAKDNGQIDRSLGTVAIAQFALALGMGMGIGQLIGREQPTPEGWTEIISRVLASASPAFSLLFDQKDTAS